MDQDQSQTKGRKSKKKIKKKKDDNYSTADLMNDLGKEFSKAGFLSDQETMGILPCIFPSFNRASLIGGLPSSCIVELHGPNQGGKTALGIALLVSAQQQGHFVGMVDAEGSIKNDKNEINKWPKALGLDTDPSKLIYISAHKKSFEDVADRLNDSIESFLKKQEEHPELKDKWMVYLVDSMTSLVPRDELEGSIGKSNYGLQAALASRWLKKLNNLILGTNVSVIFVNQERKKINAQAFGKTWQSSCGEALQYYGHFRVRVTRYGKVNIGSKENKKTIGYQHQLMVEKNKVSACDEKGFFFTGNGSDEATPLGWDMPRLYVTEGVTVGIVTKASSKVFCDYNEKTKEGMQESKLIKLLKSDEEAMEWFKGEFERLIDEQRTTGTETD